MALSLLCGGLGVASAADVTVHVDASLTPNTATEVYTTTGVNTLLNGKADKTALDTKANATDVAKNTENIATNQGNIKKLEDDKLSKDVASATYATNKALNDLENAVTNKVDESVVKEALDGKANTDLSNLTADGENKIKNIMSAGMDSKADKTTVDAVAGKVTALENTVGNDSRGLVKDVNDLRTQGTTLNNALGTKANKSDLEDANNRITVNEGNITALQNKTVKLSADGTELKGMTTVETGTLKVTGGISNDTGVTTTLDAIDASMKQTVTNKGDIATNKANIATNTTAINDLKTKTKNQQTAIDGLDAKTTKITYDAAKGTNVDGVTFNAGAVTDVTSINGTVIGEKESGTYIHQDRSIWGNMKIVDTQVKTNADDIKTNQNAITALDTKVGTVGTGEYLAPAESIGKNLGRLDAGLKNEVDDRTAADNDLSKRIGTVDADGNYIKKSATNNVSENLKVLDNRAKVNADAIAQEAAKREEEDNKINTKIGSINNTQTEYVKEGQTISQNLTKLDNELKDTNDRTGGITRNLEGNQTTIEEKVTVNNSGDVGGVKGLSAETITTGALTVTGKSDLKGDVILGTPNGTNTVTVNGESHFKAAVEMENGLTVKNGDTTLKDTTVKGNLNVTGTITTDTMIFGDKPTNYTEIDKGHITSKNAALAGDATQQSSSMEFDRTKLEVGVADKDSNGHLTMTADQTSIKNSDLDGKNYSEIVADKDSVTTTVKDEKDNTTSTKSTATEIRNYAKDAAGNKTINLQTATQNKSWAKDKDGNESSIVQTGKDITNTAEKGTITSKAKDIVNDASGNISNKSQTMDTTVTGKATESYGSLDTTVNGNETHIVKGTKTETVDGKVTENYKAGQATNVTGNQDIHVTGKQTNTVEGGQENIISGGQTNTITGGQINNITGDQTTTITGNKTETVTENVTEDYKKDLTTTVGGNETHKVKGTKTETVEGKVTENFKNGQETNVTGDQVIKVSGTQTTTATDINRNASSGMIDTIDNDYGTNTETKVAGKTTTDVSIKGTGEEGKYIRGANESRDYLIKGTLKNSETKTVEKTSTEITDGNGKTSATIQDKTQISGSVTNGTSSAVSNVKADSIDTAVIEGTNTSLISQKKDSITSAVGNGTTSTVIQQGDKDITIASNGGTVGIASKDIINKATDEIINTAGTKITDKVGNNTRVIDQTSITDTVGTASRKIEDGKITDTAGDFTVTTDKANGTTFAKAGSAAYSTKAGASTDTNIAGNHITTGRVDANELGVSDKDDQGNTADLSVKAGEGVKASATDKDGNKTSTKVTATENSFQVQDKDGNIKNHQVNTKDKSENTIKNGDKTNIVTSTADGTTFNNSKANTAFEGGTYTDTTIKGNTITTGKVTMDYADVMKDLGVRGNANITGKTTTGSLEVTGTSTLKGDVTMGSNATVKKDLTVNGTTNLKDTNVGGKLDVTGKATFSDDVDIKKNLSVVGDVTANSYKVGDNTYIDKNGIHANGQKITDVADGSISEGSKDAVNGGQLYGVKNDLEGKVNKVGANAAAMANLHPMEFDPDSKWNIAAAIGNYGSETAAALGAFYRPNDDVMVNLSTAFGTGENMVGGGVSVRLGKGGNKLSREESNALKDQVNDLTARMDALLSVLNPNMSKDFPDVPENHWAYEAVSRLAGNDIVQGYPDGEFHGERTMTRYEMAEIIYNALSRGAEAEKELVEEFKPELQAMAASEKATAEKAEG